MVTEFQFIENIKSRYSLEKIGDDCAVLRKDAYTDLLLTADMLVEDIDFRLDWTTPEFLGHKALAVSLSDIAAMGGGPKWAMLSIGIPLNLWDTDLLDRFYEGWFSVARHFGVELVGGDVSKTLDKLVIDSIIGGEIEKGKAILRSGAKPGDAIYVTGSLGGAIGGLKLLETGVKFDCALPETTRNLLLQQLQPQPQVDISKLLYKLHIVHSMIDMSDGLSSDITHLCAASSRGARINAELLPVDTSLLDHFPANACLEMALNGGEDFQLLFTADEKKVFEASIDGITRIGEITANVGIIELIRYGKTEILEPKGFSHF